MVRATRSMAWTPRLPIPTAIVPPGFTRSRRRLPRIKRRTVPGTSSTRGWGIDWLHESQGRKRHCGVVLARCELYCPLGAFGHRTHVLTDAINSRAMTSVRQSIVAITGSYRVRQRIIPAGFFVGTWSASDRSRQGDRKRSCTAFRPM